MVSQQYINILNKLKILCTRPLNFTCNWKTSYLHTPTGFCPTVNALPYLAWCCFSLVSSFLLFLASAAAAAAAAAVAVWSGVWWGLPLPSTDAAAFTCESPLASFSAPASEGPGTKLLSPPICLAPNSSGNGWKQEQGGTRSGLTDPVVLWSKNAMVGHADDDSTTSVSVASLFMSISPLAVLAIYRRRKSTRSLCVHIIQVWVRRGWTCSFSCAFASLRERYSFIANSFSYNEFQWSIKVVIKN